MYPCVYLTLGQLLLPPQQKRDDETKSKQNETKRNEPRRMYSKSMSSPESEFTQGADEVYKQALAEKAYGEAAEKTGLSAVYRRLRDLQTWHKKSGDGRARRLE